MVREFQKGGGDENLREIVVDAAYQYHSHTSSCFLKTESQGKKRPNDSMSRCCNCRYRMPQRKKARTVIEVYQLWKNGTFGMGQIQR